MDAPTAADLAPTPHVDADHPEVVAFARDHTAGVTDPVERAIALFEAVRDGVRYDPYRLDLTREGLRASTVLDLPASWCVPKSMLLAAAARVVGIPARLGFADVRNHLSTPRLLEAMGTDVFRWHGYATLHLDGAWRKASTAFNAELCERFGVEPLAFDGRSDALLHAHDGRGERYMEYLVDRGTFSELPYDEMTAGLRATYPDLVGAAPGASGDHAWG